MIIECRQSRRKKSVSEKADLCRTIVSEEGKDQESCHVTNYADLVFS